MALIEALYSLLYVPIANLRYCRVRSRKLRSFNTQWALMMVVGLSLRDPSQETGSVYRTVFRYKISQVGRWVARSPKRRFLCLSPCSAPAHRSSLTALPEIV